MQPHFLSIQEEHPGQQESLVIYDRKIIAPGSGSFVCEAI